MPKTKKRTKKATKERPYRRLNARPRVKPKARAATATNWERVDALTDDEIETAVREDRDAAPLIDEGWVGRAHIVMPDPKRAISFRVDKDVLDFFKAHGPRYQTRMNAVLRAYMTARGD